MNVHGLTRRITRQTDVAAIMRTAVEGAREVLGVELVAIATATDDRSAFTLSVMSGARTEALRDVVLRPMVGLGGRVAALRRPIIVRDYLVERSITQDFVDAVREEGIRGAACVPVLTAQGLTALLYAAQRHPWSLSENALNTLVLLGTVVGVAIDQAFDHARQRELVALRERQRLATTLHDSVAQSLFAIGVEARRARPNQQDPSVVLEQIGALASQASAELRETLHQINEVPARMSLAVALDAKVRTFERTSDLAVRLVTNGAPRPTSDLHEALICDTVHEGLRNAIKHAGAQLAVVHLRYGKSDIGLTIQCDRRAQEGACATTQRLVAPQLRGGLRLLHDRAEALHGTVTLVLGEEDEAILRLTLPHDRPPEGPNP